MLRSSTQSGRISFVLLAGLCSAALIVALFLFSGDTPRSGATDFMSALALGDAKKLADRSIMNDKSKAEMEQAWKETLRYSRSFLFHWSLGAIRQDGDTATVKLDFTKNPVGETAYAEHFELVMVKTPEGWKVDVPQMSREMYPYLPQ